jgi:hypothetical protein
MVVEVDVEIFGHNLMSTNYPKAFLKKFNHFILLFKKLQIEIEMI